ncbi:MAG: PIN domain-containing protein [Pseudomonadota bacterium]
MKSVFVDSGGFFAHLVAEDALHDRALECFERVRAERWDLVTTNAVVVETYALLINRARGGRHAAIGLLDALDQGLCDVVRVNRRDEHRAMELVRAHHDKTYSLCDALSFVVMERLDITHAIAFDRHFSTFGRFAII